MSIIKKLYKGLGNVTFQGIAVVGVELARGIEPPTCGLQTVSDPTADNLNPQETTKQDPPDMGPDGAGLSYPGSRVVAEDDG